MYHLKRLIFYLEHHERLFSVAMIQKNRECKKLQIFDENHGLTPLKKANFATFLIRHFCHLEKLVFYLERHERLFWAYLIIKKRRRNLKFYQNCELTP